MCENLRGCARSALTYPSLLARTRRCRFASLIADFGAVNALFSMVGVLSRIAGNVVFPRVLKGSQEGKGLGGALGDGAINFVASALMAVAAATALWATGKFRPADTGDANSVDGEDDDLAPSVREDGLVGLSSGAVELTGGNVL